MLVQGFGVAMLSCIPPMFIILGVVILAHAYAVEIANPVIQRRLFQT
jgi:hypothetical protein